MNLIIKFRQKLKSRKIPLSKMFKVTGIHKSVFSYVKNNKVKARRLTIEKIKYWIKHNKKHPSINPKDGYFFCVECLELLPIATKISKKNKSGNRCKPCEVKRQRYWDSLDPDRIKKRRARQKKRLTQPGPQRDNYLERRKNYYLKMQYGEYWQCAKTIQQIRGEYGAIKFDKLTKRTMGDSLKTES